MNHQVVGAIFAGMAIGFALNPLYTRLFIRKPVLMSESDVSQLREAILMADTCNFLRGHCDECLSKIHEARLILGQPRRVTAQNFCKKAKEKE